MSDTEGEALELARREQAKSVFLAAETEIAQLLDRAKAVVQDPHYSPSEIHILWDEIRRIDDEKIKPALEVLCDPKK